MTFENTQIEGITLTPVATLMIKNLLQERNLPNHALRVFVSGGGCSGVQYGMALEGKIREQDWCGDFDGVKVVVDEVSIQYLHGSIIDYIDNELGSGFKIDNPNVMPTCGAGGCEGCH